MLKNNSPATLLFAICSIQREAARAAAPDFPSAYPDTSFDMKYDTDNSEVVIEVTTENDHYFGFGFGTTTMGTGNDMIMCTSSTGSLACSDMYSAGNASPTVDSAENLTVTGSTSSGLNHYEIRRALDTGDSSHDYVIALDTEFDMIWSLGTSSNSVSSGHGSDRNSFTATVNSDGSYSFSTSSDSSPDEAAPSAFTMAGTKLTLAIFAATLALF